MKIYLASPFFNKEEKTYMETVLRVLRNSGYDVFAPYEFVIPNAWDYDNATWGKMVFEGDIEELKKADIVVAINNGLRSDTGTAFEIGCAYILKKKIFTVYFDNNIDSLMINNSSKGDINYNDFLNNEKINLDDYINIKSKNEQK